MPQASATLLLFIVAATASLSPDANSTLSVADLLGHHGLIPNDKKHMMMSNALGR